MSSSSSTIRMLPGELRRARSRQARSAEADNTPADLVGRKVSILYRLDGDPAHPFSEVVGVVQRVEEAVILIRKRDGTAVEVVQSSIVKLKIVPTSGVAPAPGKNPSSD